MQSLVTSVMFGKRSILSPCLCLPAERLLHQLPAAPLGSSEPDHRRRRQQVSGGREQQTAATGVQLRLDQAHEAHLDVQSGKTHTQTGVCACVLAFGAPIHEEDIANSSCERVLHISAPRLWWIFDLVGLLIGFPAASSQYVSAGPTLRSVTGQFLQSVPFSSSPSLCPCVNTDHFPSRCLRCAFKSPSSWVG